MVQPEKHTMETAESHSSKRQKAMHSEPKTSKGRASSSSSSSKGRASHTAVGKKPARGAAAHKVEKVDIDPARIKAEDKGTWPKVPTGLKTEILAYKPIMKVKMPEILKADIRKFTGFPKVIIPDSLKAEICNFKGYSHKRKAAAARCVSHMMKEHKAHPMGLTSVVCT